MVKRCLNGSVKRTKEIQETGKNGSLRILEMSYNVVEYMVSYKPLYAVN
jgi:hypothetical protein